MLFLVLQANYGEKISLMQIFSLVNTNAPGLMQPHSPDPSPNSHTPPPYYLVPVTPLFLPP